MLNSTGACIIMQQLFASVADDTAISAVFVVLTSLRKLPLPRHCQSRRDLKS